jgi:hypothetical protein
MGALVALVILVFGAILVFITPRRRAKRAMEDSQFDPVDDEPSGSMPTYPVAKAHPFLLK